MPSESAFSINVLAYCTDPDSTSWLEEVNSLCMPVRSTWNWNNANLKKVPDSRGSQESRNFFQNFNIPVLSALKSMGSVFTSSSLGLGPGNTVKKISTALVLLHHGLLG
jgi:hypothetical protein